MAARALHLDSGNPDFALINLPPVFVSWWRKRNSLLVLESQEDVGLKAINRRAANVCWTNMRAFQGRETATADELQEILWRRFFSDTALWWDNRKNKKTPLHPDFKSKRSKDALWLSNRHKPAWVDSRLAMLDAGPMMPLEPGASTEVAFDRLGIQVHEDKLEVEMCRKLCEDGLMTDAVDALNFLVQRGSYVPANLFHRVIKRCTALKDLALCRRIHALTLRSGYEGDAFLATHLIGLYASLEILDEAIQVFGKVSKPSVHNWAAIILACAKHGEPTRAIRMYQQMLESNLKADNHVLVAVLKACAIAGDLAAGKDVHAHVLANAGRPHMFVETCLVDMYAKCGSLEDARNIFDRLLHKNVVTWNAMISGYAQQGMGEEALSLYNVMLQEGTTPPDSVTFTCLLQACAALGEVAMHQGQQLHSQIEELGMQDDVVIGGSLVNMYTKCGHVRDARRVFDRLQYKNKVTWTAMIAGYSQHEMGYEALEMYLLMQQEGISPADSVTFVCLLQACASIGDVGLSHGKQLQDKIEERGLHDDVVLGCSLVDMYAKCGSTRDARRVFDKLSDKSMMTWTAMIAAYTQQGMGQEALSLYTNMPRKNIPSVTYVCLLQACAIEGEGALQLGRLLHSQIEERGLFEEMAVGGSLVNMYAKCGSIRDAHKVFERLPHRNLAACNVMIAGYGRLGMGREALSLYRAMQQEFINPDAVTFVCLLNVCAGLGDDVLDQGKQLHAQIKERFLQADVTVGNSLVKMYSKCGSIEDAREVFDNLPHRNVVTWNLMIAASAQHGMAQDAFSVYHRMRQECVASPNSVTFVTLLQACAMEGEVAVQQGIQLHVDVEERGLQSHVMVGASLVHMYAKCCSMRDARRLFDKLSQKNVVTWTTMISGYAHAGMCEDAISLYRSMQQDKFELPNSVTFVGLLQACATAAALPLGKLLHADIEQLGLQADADVRSGLIRMYSKCGSMADSQQVFNSCPERGIAAWGALIAGYACKGDSDAVFSLFDKMILEGVQPDAITFLSVLTVCSYVGLLAKGREYFKAMETEYRITPTMDHYRCMIDLVGRAGHLDEALQMAKSLPLAPTGAVWLTLLGACRKWCNVWIGRHAFELAVNLDEKNAPAYILMSSIYADAGMWEDAKEVQAKRVECKAWKAPGQSWWTDVGGVVHSFLVGEAAPR